MSDEALAWKAGFGALLLLFSGTSFLMRKHAQVAEQPAPAAATHLAAPASSARPAPQLSLLPQHEVTAPLDVQEDAPAVRVEVTLHDKDDAQPATASAPSEVRATPRKPSLQPAPPAARERTSKFMPRNVQHVAAKRSRSPYQPGRTHYPYDPKERWALRDTP
jgi:hypothetical protein